MIIQKKQFFLKEKQFPRLRPKMPRRFWKKAWSIFLCLVLALSLPGCGHSEGGAQEAQGTSTEGTAKSLAAEAQNAFEDFVLDEFVDSFEDDLVGLHFAVQNPSAYGIEEPERAFPPLTEERDEEAKKDLQELSGQLAAFDRSKLTKKQQFFHETLSHYVNQQLKLGDYTQFVNVLDANQGVSSQLPVTLSEYAFYTEEDIRNYLSVLTQISDYFDEALAWEQSRTAAGFGMEDFEIEDTIAQIDSFLEEREENLLVDTFEERMEGVASLSADQKNTYRKNNENLLNSTVFPAFLSLREGLEQLNSQASDEEAGAGGDSESGSDTGQTESESLGSSQNTASTETGGDASEPGRTEGGLCNYEGGKEYYELLIQSMTLSDRSISQMTRTLEKRMDTIMERVKKIYKDSPNVYDILSGQENFTEETPEEMLERLKSCIQGDYPALSDVAYTVAPIPDALKDNVTAAYYMIPPLDGSGDNRIYYNEAKRQSASLFTTLAHEGYPGHLYQNNYFLSSSPYPLYYLMDMAGYKEGWAYYVEIDCSQYNDYGEYDREYHDSLVELSRCNDEFGYCLSSLIDLYVNDQGFTQQQVGDVLETYGLDATGAQSFYEYAVEEPGSYLQYYIGYLELLSLRSRAEKSLGDAFDALEFHKVILDAGPCYYSQLEQEVSDWVEASKKSQQDGR